MAAARGGRQPLKLFPCHYDGSLSAAIAAAIESAAAICIAVAAAVSAVFMFSFAGAKLWPNCQPGVLSWDLGQYFFGCCLVNSCGGLFR